MNNGYILTIDQGTSSSKAVLVNKKGDIISSLSKAHKQYYPQPEWLEHDPVEIYENVKYLFRKILKSSDLIPRNISAVSITNQRDTIVFWDRITGEPVCNALVWQCRRSADICKNLIDEGLESKVREAAGQNISPYYSASKIKWVMQNMKDLKRRAKKGEILVGTIDSWLIWKLTGGKVHATDYSNANSTLLINIKEKTWDEDLLKIFDVPRNILPEIRCSTDIFGRTAKGELFDVEIPISGIIGDSQGALFGEQCFEHGMAKVTYGTGSSIMVNMGKNLVIPEKGLSGIFAWGVDNEFAYVIEGDVTSAGDALKWVEDNLGLFDDYEKAEKIASELGNNEGVYLLPAFSGLGAPYWAMNTRAAIVGISRSARKAHIIRAAMESTAYQVCDVINTIEIETGMKIDELRVNGGLTRNNFLMQFQADMLNKKIEVSSNPGASALGSAYLAGLGVGLWKDLGTLKGLRKKGKVLTPSMDKTTRKKNYQGWKDAVSRIVSDS